MTTKVSDDVVVEETLGNDTPRCHVCRMMDGQIVQCTNVAKWWLIRKTDGVLRGVCDPHKVGIYDAHEPESKLVLI